MLVVQEDLVGRAVPLLVLRVSLDEHDALLSAGHPFFAPRADRDRELPDPRAEEAPRAAGKSPALSNQQIAVAPMPSRATDSPKVL